MLRVREEGKDQVQVWSRNVGSPVPEEKSDAFVAATRNKGLTGIFPAAEAKQRLIEIAEVSARARPSATRTPPWLHGRH